MEAALTGLPEFERIDWRAPWLQDWCAWENECTGTGWRDALNARAVKLGMLNASGLPLRFVEQLALPDGAAYEAFIAETGSVPTRANLHDFFNALIWLSYPQLKSTLNLVQARELATHGVGQTRGSVRDKATLFDENAVVFAIADPALAQALRSHEWENLFIKKREAFGTSCEIFPFGHALLEKLTSPFKAITAHAWLVSVDPDFFHLSRSEQRRLLDIQVAQQVEHSLSVLGFAPLPVLGVPGWAEGQDEAYYRDQSVFRPKFSLTQGSSPGSTAGS